jgi:predicted Fe-S protein YdhL (DUF1289 family)
MAKKSKSPCVSICEFSGPKGWCIGCGLTRPECGKWKSLKPFDRTNLEKELKRRLTKMGKK